MLDSILFLAATEVATHGAEAVAHGADASNGLLQTFGVDWKIILFQAINFGIVAFLLWRFAFKPVMATMDERQKKISDGLQYAEEAKQQLASAEKEKADMLRVANGEAQKLIQDAKTRAEALAAELAATAEREIAEKRRRADESIAQERQKVLAEARKDIARLVVLTSSKVLSKELSEDDKSRFNASAAKEVAALN